MAKKVMKFNEKRMAREKLYSPQKGREAESLNTAAELDIAQWQNVPQMMAAALIWIDETEAEVLKLPGARELLEARKRKGGFTNAEEKEALKLSDIHKNQRELILSLLSYLGAARQSNKDNDPVQTIRWFPLIEQKFKFIHLLRQRIKEIEGGGKGGRKGEKRSIWADEVANQLNEKYPALKKNDAWNMIQIAEPGVEISEEWKLDTDAAEYAIYRDNENLIGVNTLTQKESVIKKSTFFKEYFLKRK